MKRMSTLLILACMVFLLGGAGAQAAERASRSAHDFAVYSEYSDSDKPMQAGANTRVFNRVEVESAPVAGRTRSRRKLGRLRQVP